jgi:hypothetical protein
LPRTSQDPPRTPSGLSRTPQDPSQDPPPLPETPMTPQESPGPRCSRPESLEDRPGADQNAQKPFIFQAAAQTSPGPNSGPLWNSIRSKRPGTPHRPGPPSKTCQDCFPRPPKTTSQDFQPQDPPRTFQDHHGAEQNRQPTALEPTKTPRLPPFPRPSLKLSQDRPRTAQDCPPGLPARIFQDCSGTRYNRFATSPEPSFPKPFRMLVLHFIMRMWK